MAEDAATSPKNKIIGLDENGNGTGCIITPNGGVYEGQVREWKRHGLGSQRWVTGESFKGTWEDDMQAKGVFIDSVGRKWKGDFQTRQVKLIPSDPYQGGSKAKTARRPHRQRNKKKSGARSARGPRVVQTTSFSAEQGKKALEHMAALSKEYTAGPQDVIKRKRGQRFVKEYKESDFTPGPGAYDPPLGATANQLSSPKYSMGKRQPTFIDYSIKASNTPGPVYKPITTQTLRNAGSSKMADPVVRGLNNLKKKVPLSHLVSPGPCYDRQDNTTGGQVSKLSSIGRDTTFGMGDQHKPPHKFAIIGPGPGVYYPDAGGRLGDKPSWSLTSRKPVRLPDAVPGSAKYSPDQIKFRFPTSPSAAFPGSERMVDPTVSIGKIPYSTPRHLKENLNVFSPGPAYYDKQKADRFTRKNLMGSGFGTGTNPRFVPVRPLKKIGCA